MGVAAVLALEEATVGRGAALPCVRNRGGTGAGGRFALSRAVALSGAIVSTDAALCGAIVSATAVAASLSGCMLVLPFTRLAGQSRYTRAPSVAQNTGRGWCVAALELLQPCARAVYRPAPRRNLWRTQAASRNRLLCN